MNIWDLIIIIAVAAAAGFAIRNIVRGRGSCSCGSASCGPCADCPHCGKCSSAKRS